MSAKFEINNVLEEYQKILDLLNSLNNKRIIIWGKSKAVENIKNIINEQKELFSEYEINYYTSEKFESDEEVCLIPYEERTKCLFDYMEKSKEWENKDNV